MISVVETSRYIEIHLHVFTLYYAFYPPLLYYIFQLIIVVGLNKSVSDHMSAAEVLLHIVLYIHT